MCGLAGAFSLVRSKRPPAAVVEAMAQALEHRGPDDRGLYSDDTCALGHRRLTIIDLTPAGRQPFTSPCGRYKLVYNGEIYNFRALRKSLEAQGECFISQSDTEVLLRLFTLYGHKCAGMVQGMFAFAVMDLRERRLHLCRDRAGEKPLYYTQSGGIFYFASEVKAFWRNPDIPRELDPEGVIRYFAYTQPPPPHTLFKSVSRLPPGHWLTIDQARPPQLRPYWQLDFTRKTEASEADLVEELESLLGCSTEAATVADRPLGLMLSGGLDSSLIHSLLTVEARRDMKCYTVGARVEAEDCDDLYFARRQALAAGLDHEVFRFGRSTFADAREVLGKLDEPVGVYDSVISLFHTREIARSRRVILTGSGADELFAGYPSYLEWVDGRTARRMGSLRGPDMFSPLASDLRSAALELGGTYLSARLMDLVRDLDWEADFGWLQRISMVETALDARLVSELFVSMSHCASMFDSVGMAYGVEYRSPFFDEAVMAFAARLSDAHRVGDEGKRTSKRLLRCLASRHLSRSQIHKRKTGYADSVSVGSSFLLSWRGEIIDALNRNADALSDFLNIPNLLALTNYFPKGSETTAGLRRLQKVALFLAWFDSQESCRFPRSS